LSTRAKPRSLRIGSAGTISAGDYLRTIAPHVKVAATEMLTRIADRAIQIHGGLGVSHELGIEYVARHVRMWRIVEGPSEVHRWLIARQLLKEKKPYNPFIVAKDDD